MKRISIALAFALAACSGGGPSPVPSPVPSPTATPAPACGSSLVVRPAHGATALPGMRPRSYPRAKGGQLKYGGGPVLLDAQVYLVFWGMSASDPVAQREVQLYENVGGSTWLNTVTQYCESPNFYIVNAPGMLAGEWADPSNPPAAPTQAQIAAEAEAAVPHFAGLDKANASVVVALPHGIKPVGFGTQYCAWHAATNDGLSYTNLPYMPDAGLGCGAAVGDPLAGVSIVGGHELAESITDPQPSSGWTGPGGEIGDECAWNPAPQIVALNGVSEYMQALWANNAHGCAF